MARKPTIDVEKTVQMLREGKSTQVVAEYFGVSRQAIDLHRRKFIRNGQLDDKRAAPQISDSPLTVGGEKSAGTGQVVSLDRLIELIIQAFDSLKKLPQIEAELARYKQEYQKAATQIEQLEKEAVKRREQETRWQVAMSARESPQHSDNVNQ